MEWFLVQAQDLHGMFSSLGSFIGNDYHIGENCLASLGEILSYLTTEDRTMRNFRRALGVSQVIQMDLIPLLIHAKDDMTIMDATIRVLVNLTLPVECLLSPESLSQTNCGRQTISDLNHLLLNVKQAFVDPRVTNCLIQRMRSTIDMGRKLLAEECEGIGNCLLLLRNILHIPDNKAQKVHGKLWHPALDSNGNGAASGASNQNLILWNIFAQNIDKVLLHLMTCPQRAEWDVPMVQLVALTYKDQHMTSLLKMLQLWLETTMSSESSEDNESNTSPQPLSQGSDNSSPVMTSEATSDSSDNGGAANEGGKKLQKGERSKGAHEESEESVKQVLMAPNVDSLDEKQKDCKYDEESSQSCAVGQEINTKQDTLVDENVNKHNEEEKEQVCQKKEAMKSKKVAEEENINADKDSGVFSQDSSYNRSIYKKGHMPSYQRHFHHQHHPHRYPHHHRSHHPHSTNKKDSAAASSTSTNTPKGNAVSELSDCGYSTQKENQPESLSTSSNEDEGPIAKRSMKPGHQKHHSLRQHQKLDANNLTNPSCGVPVKVQKSNLRRKRLVKRIHSANVKGVLHHIPTDDDISNLLKEFTFDFLLQGYGPLVSGLYMKLLSCCTHRAPGVRAASPPPIICSKPSLLPSSPIILRSASLELPPPPIDTSHFFWLITFFLRFSSQLELELEHISMVLSYDILSYLVYEGVGLCEEVELAVHHCHESDVKPCLRRIHLVVTAIREFVQAVESYEKMAMSIPGRDGDRDYLQMLQRQMAATRDLRCLFVLLLQHYNPSVMSKQYLQDIVVTNHVLLLFLEGGNGMNSISNNSNCNKRADRRNSLIEEVDMMDHIQHFANRGIVQKYGQLLAAFEENGEFVNDCVFTMLHHIGGVEVNRPETLFQPTLLRAFSAMWEADFDMCDDWSDLIEYIIHKFISNPQHSISPKNPGIGINPLGLPLGGNILVSDKNEQEESKFKWSMQDFRDLRWFYAQSCREKNVLAKIVKLYRQKSGVTKSRTEVLNQLLSQNIIDSSQYASLKRAELPGEPDDTFKQPFSPPIPVSIDFDDAENWEGEEANKISKLKVNLIKEGLEKEIHWLQGALLEACYVKLWMKKQKEGISYDSTHFQVMEPVPYHYALMGQPIPIIPWGIDERRAVIQNTTFGQLLLCLGIEKPREDGIGGIYPRIPTSFTPLDLLEAAKKLGNLTTGNMKFDPAELYPMEMEEEWRENFKVPSEALQRNPDNKSPVHLHNTPPQLSPQPATCSLQTSPSEINIMATANSNINWLSIVGRSKNLSLTDKLPLKKEIEDIEVGCKREKGDTNITSKVEY